MSLTGIQFSENYGSGSQLSTTLSFTSVTTGHSLIVAVSSFYPIDSVTDSVGNTYTRDVLEITPPTQFGVSIWRAINVTGGANIVVTAATEAPSGPIAIFVQEYAATLLTLHGAKTTRGTVSGTTTISPGALGHFMPAVSWVAAAFNRATSVHSHAPPTGYSNHRDQQVASSFLWFNLAYDFFTSGLRDPSWVCNIFGSTYAVVHVVYYEAISANFTATPLSGAATLQVVFTDASAGDPTSWFWQFGDGQLSTEQHPTVDYATAGTYSPVLTVRRGNVPDSTLQRSNYIVVSAGPPVSGGPPVQPPSISQQATSPTTILAAYGLGFAAAFSPPIQPTFPPPPPDQTALEVEQEILNLNLLREMVQAITTEQGSSDPVRLSEAVRQMTRIVDGLLYVNQLQMTGDGEYELITGGWSDADEPTSNDLAGDGEVWIEWPSVYRSRRDRMPPDTEDESDPTLWVSVVQDDGSVLWFEVELYPEGWTSLGVTGTF